MKMKKRSVFLSFLSLTFIVILLFPTMSASAIGWTVNAEIISSTYDRKSIDRVDISVTANFTLNNNYTTLKFVFKVLNDNSDVAGVIASKTVDYANYLNGTTKANEVQVSTTITAYDADANAVGVQSGDKVYLRLYVYNNSVSSSNLIVKSAFDQDWWPAGGRYSSTTTSSSTAVEDSNRKWIILAAVGIGAILLVVVLGGGLARSPKKYY